MASANANVLVTLKLPKGFDQLSEKVQLAIVDRLHWELVNKTVVQVDAASLTAVMKADTYRRVRLN